MMIGVNTHPGTLGIAGSGAASGGTELFASWMALARLNSARDNVLWNDAESPAGSFQLRWGALATTRLWQSMPASFSPLMVLPKGNVAYESGGQPKSDTAVAAFARYAAWSAKYAYPQSRMVEIWNEWNLGTAGGGAKAGIGSQGDAGDYVRLAAAAYREIKASRPDVSVVVGAVGYDCQTSDCRSAWQWTQRAIQLGLLSHGDVLSVHVYNRWMSPDLVGADEAISRLDRLRTLVVNAGKPNMPIHVTEVGWPTHLHPTGVSEDESALHITRFLLYASLRDWLSGVWLYDFQDDGADPTALEHNMGLMRYIGTEKPSGCAVRRLAHQIARRPKSVTHAAGVTMARFANGATDRWILWADAAKVYAVGNAEVRLTSQSRRLWSRIRPSAVCTVTGGTLRRTHHRTTTAKLSGKDVLVLDLPATERISLQPLN